ncbi:hypothetical protein EJ03DRAFT_177807 [Teratosphaeria nubilosa]|uniref:Rhodopsin domain-containing protein n=1 Tax=Teratosphaeria nubilosa TaxID=161662 RepID=A0A6G1L1Z9_9PEZI|nr:hypothetical protein EJ03DRAFT_177807 [Teratosphaeria nubilosa]
MEVYAPMALQLVCTFFIVISWIAVGLRVWVRHFILHSFGRDDWAMLLTQIGLTIWYPSQMTAIHYGAGRHMWNLSDRNATIALALIYFNEISYFFVSVLVKTALCLFLLRIAKERIHILILKNLMYGNIVVGGAFFFVLTFQCWPIASFWNIDPISAQDCVPPSVIVGLFYGMSALNIVADWTIGTLPFFMLRGLQIPLRQKRIVQGILAFAAIGSSATVIRTPYLAGLADSYSGRGGDFTYKIGGILLWTCVELSVGIIAGSVVTLRPMIRAMFDRFGGSYTDRGCDDDFRYRTQ